MKILSKQKKVLKIVEELEVGQSFNKEEVIKKIWGECDYFITRSFDVYLSSAKKQLPEKEFKTEKGFVIRTK